jgi:hypothetical protein
LQGDQVCRTPHRRRRAHCRAQVPRGPLCQAHPAADQLRGTPPGSRQARSARQVRPRQDRRLRRGRRRQGHRRPCGRRPVRVRLALDCRLQQDRRLRRGRRARRRRWGVTQLHHQVRHQRRALFTLKQKRISFTVNWKEVYTGVTMQQMKTMNYNNIPYLRQQVEIKYEEMNRIYNNAHANNRADNNPELNAARAALKDAHDALSRAYRYSTE